MATEQNLILNLPFDENDGSTVAFDYAQNRHDAEIVSSHFVSGRQGNCIRFDGTGYAEINGSVINLSQSFTILAWVKPNKYPDGCTGKKIGLVCNTDTAENGYREIWVDVLPDSWGFVTVRKSGNSVSLYLDTQLKEVITLPSNLTGIALVQDIYGSEYGYCDLDEVKVYNIALSPDEISSAIDSVKQLEYYLNGVNFKDFDLHVSASSGVLDLPKLKAPMSIDWKDYHGEVIDLTDKRYEAREITLNCWLRAKGKLDFVEKCNALFAHFTQDGTSRLEIHIHPTKPLVYEVYLADGVQITKRWHDDKMIGTLTLKLKEPDPVKRVVRHQRLNAASSTLTLSFKTEKMVTVYWGDGTVSEDLYGDFTGANALTHNYADNGIYYAIVGGVLELITDFTTNGIVVWNKL